MPPATNSNAELRALRVVRVDPDNDRSTPRKMSINPKRAGDSGMSLLCFRRLQEKLNHFKKIVVVNACHHFM